MFLSETPISRTCDLQSVTLPLVTSQAPSSQTRGNSGQRWLVSVLALGALAVQLLAFIRSWHKHDEFQLLVGSGGIALVIAIFIVNWRLPSPMSLVGRLAVLTLSGRIAADIVQDLLEHSWTGSIVLLEVQILGMVLFAILPTRLAAPFSALLYALTVASAVNANVRVPTELGLLAVGLGTAAFAARYSHYVNEEQVRSAYLEGQLAWDALTGTLSRRGLEKELGTLWRTSSPEQTLLLMVDVDHFKGVNDSYGHLTGDQALQMIGVTLRAAASEHALIGRWGGEEFVMVLPCQSAREHQQVTEQLLHTIRTLRVDHLPPLTISAGGATFAEAPSLEAVIALADSRLYQAKDGG